MFLCVSGCPGGCLRWFRREGGEECVSYCFFVVHFFMYVSSGPEGDLSSMRVLLFLYEFYMRSVSSMRVL